MFAAFRATPLQDVRVVIVGQDPYPDPALATGIAFSVHAEVRPHPASLRNIMHAVQSDYPHIAPAHSGDLSRWAYEEHILLLNRTLTVRERRPGSHRGHGWARFTRRAMEVVNARQGAPIVFILKGAAMPNARAGTSAAATMS